MGPWLHLPQSGLWGQSHEHSWVGGGRFGVWTPWAHLPPAGSQLLLAALPVHISVDPGSLRATALPRSLPCPSSASTEAVLLGAQGAPGSAWTHRTYLHWGTEEGLRRGRTWELLQ